MRTSANLSQLQSTKNEPENEAPSSSIFQLIKSVDNRLTSSDILGFGISSKYLLVSTKKNEIYKYPFNTQEDPVKINFIVAEKDRSQSIMFFCDTKGMHTIIKYMGKKTNYFYLNSSSTKTKLLSSLSKNENLDISAICFNEDASEESTRLIILGSAKGRLYGFQLDEISGDKLVEKPPVELLRLKNDNTVSGISVRFYNFIRSVRGLQRQANCLCYCRY